MKSAITILATALLCNSIHAQPEVFQNLNFEQANIVPIVGNPLYPYPYGVTVANALPGWEVYYGTVQQSAIFCNDESLGATQVTLFAQGYPGDVGPIIDGNFSLLLQGGLVNLVQTPASITQTGQIPSGTESLLFDVGTFGTPEVFIGTQNISLIQIGTGPNYNIYAGNISAWAGQTEQLTFTSDGNSEIDDISFSTESVPEPDPFLLTGLGGTLFALHRRFGPKRK